MRKLIFGFLGTMVLFLISALHPGHIFAQCQINAPDSAPRNSIISLVEITNIQANIQRDNPGLRVYDSSGNAEYCRLVTAPYTPLPNLRLPVGGDSVTLKVEKTTVTGGALTNECGNTVAVLCSKTINLTGAALPSPSCSVSTSPDQITINAQNLDCANSRYCSSIINPRGFKESTQCQDWGGVCSGSMTLNFIPQVHWSTGSYTVKIRGVSETGPLVTSCGFSYTAIDWTPPKSLCPGGICQTALGPINVSSPSLFIAWLLKFAIGIGGGIAFLLMLFGVFQIITSAGDPERLKAGKELITSALMGLLLIIFSIFLLQLIGAQILQIPGFK